MRVSLLYYKDQELRVVIGYSGNVPFVWETRKRLEVRYPLLTIIISGIAPWTPTNRVCHI